MTAGTQSNKLDRGKEGKSRNHRKAVCQNCLVVISLCKEELHQALGKKDAHIAGMRIELQRLHADRAEDTAKLQQQAMEREKTLSETQRLENELHELREQINITTANMQAQIQWQENQLASQQALAEATAENTRLRSMINVPASGMLSPQLADSGLVDGSWPEQLSLAFPGQESYPQSQNSNDPTLWWTSN